MKYDDVWLKLGYNSNSLLDSFSFDLLLLLFLLFLKTRTKKLSNVQMGRHTSNHQTTINYISFYYLFECIWILCDLWCDTWYNSERQISTWKHKWKWIKKKNSYLFIQILHVQRAECWILKTVIYLRSKNECDVTTEQNGNNYKMKKTTMTTTRRKSLEFYF